MSVWPRPSAGGGDEPEGLYEGVPPWLRQSLRLWIENQYIWDASYPPTYSVDALLALERKLKRVQFDWSYQSGSSALDTIGAFIDSEELRLQEIALDVVHFTLQVVREVSKADRLALELILSDAGSAWRVAVRNGVAGLERRVGSEVATAAQRAIDTPGNAGRWLGKAWSSAYGRQPDANAAYADSIKAVEAAAQPVVLPKDTSATLGKMIKSIENAPTKWAFAITTRDNDPDPVTALLQMMRLLWRGHRARHGTSDATAAAQVEQEEAEAAVHLAATLVHWFSSGAIRRT